MARAQAVPRPPALTPTVTLPSARVRRWRLILVVAALGGAHGIGWQMTRINLPELVIGLPRAQHIIAGLLQPDSFARAREEVVGAAQVTILSPTAPTPPVSSNAGTSAAGQESAATLSITPAQVKPDQIVN